uniref:Palmdelphin n=1 Tax=Oryzias melastigma TaxID=30732 RepID=A0A3B3DQ70_ORYME
MLTWGQRRSETQRKRSQSQSLDLNTCFCPLGIRLIRRSEGAVMEESNLLKKRLQAITEKHRIQEDIRRKKLELDEMKLRLQHMKKKTLRDQWLQQDFALHSTQQQLLLQDQQQTRALQLSIYRTELEVASLEREESMILTDESFILNRLKAVERSPEDIIKEVLSRLSPDLLQVHDVTTDVPDVRSLPGNKHSEPNTPTLFDVISSAPPEELNPLTGLEASTGGGRNLHAFHTQQWSRDYRCASDLSTSELEQLVRCAAGRSQLHLHQNPFRNHEDGFNNNQDNGENQREHYEVCVVKSVAEIKGHDRWDKYQGNPQDENYCSFNVDNHGAEDQHLHSCCTSRSYSALEDEAAVFQANSMIKGHNGINQHKSCSLLPPRPHEQDAVPAATYSSPSLKDDISVEKEDLHCCQSTFYHFKIETVNNHEHCSSLYGQPRTPSPLYVEDSPYTILHTLDSTEPVTAIFMGLQAKQDDREHSQEFDGCLKAELVIIRDDHSEDTNESKHSDNENRVQSGSRGEGLERQGKHTSIRKLHKKQKSCCIVC